MISADQVADTLRLLIPGFVALKIFYWFGQRSKRADWEWTLWAVLVSAPIAVLANAIAELVGSKSVDIANAIGKCGLEKGAGKTGADLQAVLTTCASDALAANNADLRLAVALLIAALLGAGGVIVWKWLARTYPRVRERASLEAWDAVLSQPHWVQMKVGDLLYSGKVDLVADPVETDNLDIYIKEPAIIQGDNAVELGGAEGILVSRDKIDWIQVLKPAVDQHPAAVTPANASVAERNDSSG